MQSKKHIHPFWYAVADYLAATIAWIAFYFLRKKILGQEYHVEERFWLGIAIIPLCWIILYSLIGSYKSIYKKSRLTEFTNTFICTLFGCVVLFFVLLLDDVGNDYTYYYSAFGVLFGLQFPHPVFIFAR